MGEARLETDVDRLSPDGISHSQIVVNGVGVDGHRQIEFLTVDQHDRGVLKTRESITPDSDVAVRLRGAVVKIVEVEASVVTCKGVVFDEDVLEFFTVHSCDLGHTAAAEARIPDGETVDITAVAVVRLVEVGTGGLVSEGRVFDENVLSDTAGSRDADTRVVSRDRSTTDSEVLHRSAAVDPDSHSRVIGNGHVFNGGSSDRR